MTQKKLELIIGNTTKNPELLFKDLQELYTLSQCPTTEPVTVGHQEDIMMSKYGLTQINLEKNLSLYESWVNNQKLENQE